MSRPLTRDVAKRSAVHPRAPRRGLAMVCGALALLACMLAWALVAPDPPAAGAAPSPAPAQGAAAVPQVHPESGRSISLSARVAAAAAVDDVRLLVLSERGTRLAGAKVHGLDEHVPVVEPDAGDTVCAQADSQGIARLGAEEIRLAERDRRIFAVTAAGHVPALVSGLEPGLERTVVLEAGHSVEIHAADPTGRPARGVAVALVASVLAAAELDALRAGTVLVRRSPRGPPVVTGRTDAEGKTVLQPVRAGRYALRVDTTDTPYLVGLSITDKGVDVPCPPVWIEVVEPVGLAVRPSNDDVRIARFLEHDPGRWSSNSHYIMAQLAKEAELRRRFPDHVVAVRFPRAPHELDRSARVASAGSRVGWQFYDSRFEPLSQVRGTTVSMPERRAARWGSVEVDLQDPSGRHLTSHKALSLAVIDDIAGQFLIQLEPSGSTELPPGSYALNGGSRFPQAWFESRAFELRDGQRLKLKCTTRFEVIEREVIPVLEGLRPGHPDPLAYASYGFTIRRGVAPIPLSGFALNERGIPHADSFFVWIPKESKAELDLYSHRVRASTELLFESDRHGEPFLWRVQIE